MSSAEAIVRVPDVPALPAVPDGWEAKAAMVDQCRALGQRLSLWIAVLVARGVDDFSDPREWRRVCCQRWGWDKSFAGKCRDAGLLLLRPMAKVSQEKLLRLDIERLYYLSTVPANLLPRLMELHDLTAMSRDQVAEVARRYRKASPEGGELADPDAPPASTRRQLPAAAQPDFLDLLFAPPAEIDDPQQFHDQVHARAGAVDPRAAQLVAFRSCVCLNALVPRLAAQGARDLAAALRDLATQADKHAVRGV